MDFQISKNPIYPRYGHISWERRMRLLCWTVAVLAMGTSIVRAEESVAAKACIIAAAQRLPPTVGLRIIGSKTQPLPKESAPAAMQGDGELMSVLLTVDVAAQTVVYQAVCLARANSAIAELLGIVATPVLSQKATGSNPYRNRRVSQRSKPIWTPLLLSQNVMALKADRCLDASSACAPPNQARGDVEAFKSCLKQQGWPMD